jgi:hypothetical protein
MNTIRPLIASLINTLPARRSLAFQAKIGTLRYGSIKVIDYAGDCYLIPYSCSVYVEDIDGMISQIVCDIPKEEYRCSLHIIETVINRQLFRMYGRGYDVKLLPPAKNMLPPCHNLV